RREAAPTGSAPTRAPNKQSEALPAFGSLTGILSVLVGVQHRSQTAQDRRALDDDYRLCALWRLTTPVWQSGANLPPMISWNNLERILEPSRISAAGICSNDRAPDTVRPAYSSAPTPEFEPTPSGRQAGPLALPMAFPLWNHTGAGRKLGNHRFHRRGRRAVPARH